MAGTSTRERSEKAARIRREVDASLDRLADSLDSGTSEEMKAFLAAMARFHRYSFQNVMLIMVQRPDATRVAGFQTWKSMGRIDGLGSTSSAGGKAPSRRKLTHSELEHSVTASRSRGFKCCAKFVKSWKHASRTDWQLANA